MDNLENREIAFEQLMLEENELVLQQKAHTPKLCFRFVFS